MKSTTIKSALLIIFSFIFIILTSKSSYGSVVGVPVVDIDDNFVHYGVNYFVVSAIRGAGGGGLTVAGPGNGEDKCPLSVTQEHFDIDNGEPIKFLPIKPVKDNIVRECVDVNVKFDIRKNCNETTVWKAGYFDGVAGWAVTLGGVEGYHGPGTSDSMFKIQKVGFPSSYKFHFCPSYPRSRLIPCNDVGVRSDTYGNGRLVLSKQAKDFVFIKVNKRMNYPNIAI